MAGSSAPTPLYAVYQAAWGFSPITVTVIFGVYALAVLAALLVAGSLSDYVGRRPVLFAAALVQAVAMTVFATAHGLGALVVARVVQGLSTGAAAAVIGGFRVVHGGGVITTAREYSVAVIARAAFALIGALLRRPMRAAAAISWRSTAATLSRSPSRS